MGAKARCSSCRRYYPKEGMYRTGLGGLGGVCSHSCFMDLQERYRSKRIRRKEHRAKKYAPGRRLPGTARDRVKRRDSEKCRWCGTTNDVQIHHVRYRSEGGPDSPKNLLSLCDECHAHAHSDKGKYQPVLLTWLWMYYTQSREITVESVFRELQWQRNEGGYWRSKAHQDWVDAARSFSNEVYESSKKEPADG